MKISPTLLRQIIQEVINEESIADGGLKGMKELFGEFENDVMELGSDGAGQIHIDDIVTMFKNRYEPMGFGPEDMNGMMDIMMQSGDLEILGTSGFYTISDERKAWQDDERGDEEEDDTHWGADTEMTVGGTKYHSKKGDDEDVYDYEEEDFLSTASPEEVIARYSKDIKEAENKWNPLTIVMKHRGKLNVTAKMSDEQIGALDQKTLERYASQIKTHPSIKDEYTALGDWKYQENIDRMIREELAKLLK